jgi:hypothetical protein
MKRVLGRSGIEISALGMGCWAIGGPFWEGETPLGWGAVDDGESIRAIHAKDQFTQDWNQRILITCARMELLHGQFSQSWFYQNQKYGS